MDIAATERVAKHMLGIDTLVTRNSDDLDFHEIAVWQVKAALEEAYRLGYIAGQQEARKIVKHATQDF